MITDQRSFSSLVADARFGKPNLVGHPGRVAETEHDLLRPDLWHLLLPATKAARQAGREFVETGRYVPRQSLIEYEENDAGWPLVTNDARGAGTKNGPVDWSELFGLNAGVLTHILVSDVPELAEAVREISRRALDDDELMRGVSVLAPLMDPSEDRRGQVEFETVRTSSARSSIALMPLGLRRLTNFGPSTGRSREHDSLKS